MKSASPRDAGTDTDRQPVHARLRIGFYLGGFAYYVLIGAISLALLFLTQGLYREPLSIPYCYESDVLYHCVPLRAFLDGEPWHNVSRLNAPHGANLYAHPVNAYPDYALACLMSRLLGGIGYGLNTAWLIKFALTAIFAAWSFRRLGLSLFTSGLSAVAFSHLPFFVYYGLFHYFLSFHSVPLAGLLCLTVTRLNTSRLRACEMAVLGGICVLLGIGDPYLCFFTGFLLGVVTLIALFARYWYKAAFAALFASIMACSFGITLLPFRLALREARSASEPVRILAREPSPFTGFPMTLDLCQLATPPVGSLLPGAADLEERITSVLVRRKDFLPEWQQAARFGTFGWIGMLLLLMQLAFLAMPRGPGSKPLRYVRDACVLSIALLFLCCTGGLNSDVSALVSPVFRFWVRGSVLIAFFAYFAAGAYLDRSLNVPRLKRFRVPVMCGVLLFVLASTGFETRATPMLMRNPASRKAQCEEYTSFLGMVERAAPDCRNVLIFPVSNPTLLSRKSLLPYLHSTRLRWSEGPLGPGQSARPVVDSLFAEPGQRPHSDLEILSAYDAVWVDLRECRGRGPKFLEVAERLRALPGVRSFECPELNVVFLSLVKGKAVPVMARDPIARESE